MTLQPIYVKPILNTFQENAASIDQMFQNLSVSVAGNNNILDSPGTKLTLHILLVPNLLLFYYLFLVDSTGDVLVSDALASLLDSAGVYDSFKIISLTVYGVFQCKYCFE